MQTTSLKAVLFASLCVAACSAGDDPAGTAEAEPSTLELGVNRQALTAQDRLAACQVDARVQLGLVSAEICAGADIFFREDFEGNGRQCGTCHRAEDNFTISPAFIGTLPADDPLFIAELDSALATLERPQLLREFAMILENVDGTDDLANKFTLRSIPHTLSLATSLTPTSPNSPPIQHTGWSSDGAPSDGVVDGLNDGS